MCVTLTYFLQNGSITDLKIVSPRQKRRAWASQASSAESCYSEGRCAPSGQRQAWVGAENDSTKGRVARSHAIKSRARQTKPKSPSDGPGTQIFGGIYLEATTTALLRAA